MDTDITMATRPTPRSPRYFPVDLSRSIRGGQRGALWGGMAGLMVGLVKLGIPAPDATLYAAGVVQSGGETRHWTPPTRRYWSGMRK